MAFHFSVSNPVRGVAQADAVQICHQLAGYDFPWELTRSLELAVLKTFCVPRISQLLRATGEFTHRPQKRYDDTTLILGNILKWGYDSPQGRAAIARMNLIHQRFEIPNEDFIYVLSTSIFEPIRWNQRFGWRPFTPAEQDALFQFWRVVGQRMGIRDIPDTAAALERFNQAYEAQHFRYHPDNALVGEAVIRLMQGWLPAIASGWVPLVVSAIADEPMCRAFGWSRPHPFVAQSIQQALRLSRQVARYLPRRRQPHFSVDGPTVTYPAGYDLDALGPTAPLPVDSPASRCPFIKMRSLLTPDDR